MPVQAHSLAHVAYTERETGCAVATGSARRNKKLRSEGALVGDSNSSKLRRQRRSRRQTDSTAVLFRGRRVPGASVGH